MLRGVSSSMCGEQKVSASQERLEKIPKSGQLMSLREELSACLAHGNHFKLSAAFLTEGVHTQALKYFVLHLTSVEKKPRCLIGPDLSALLWEVLRLCSEVLRRVLWGTFIKRQLAKSSCG